MPIWVKIRMEWSQVVHVSAKTMKHNHRFRGIWSGQRHAIKAIDNGP
jgi:hypothetical protein